MLTRRTLLGTSSRARLAGRCQRAAGPDPHWGDQFLLRDPVLHPALSQRLAACRRTDQRRRRRPGPADAGGQSAATTPGKPQDAIRFAGELLDEQKVDILAGGYLSNVGLALSDYALQRKCLYIAGEPLSDALVWEKGNRFCFRLAPLHLHAGGNAGGGSGETAGEALGQRWRRITNTGLGGKMVQDPAEG